MRRLERRGYVVNRICNDVLAASRLKLPLKLLLVLALPTLRRFNLDADVLAGNNAHDVPRSHHTRPEEPSLMDSLGGDGERAGFMR